jgi:hypothetical protein
LNPIVETLDLSKTEARSEGRLKSLFWPSIQTANDVDYLGAQGFWVCVVVAVVAFVLSAAAGHWITGIVVLLFYYFGGVGVRERSRFAAAVVFALFVLDSIVSGLGIPRLIIIGLLLSNLRATWIATHWKPESNEAALPPRFNESWSDKFADVWPTYLWPKVRILYYALAICLLVLAAIGSELSVAALFTGRSR